MSHQEPVALTLAQPGAPHVFVAEVDAEMTFGDLIHQLEGGVAAPWLEPLIPGESVYAVDPRSERSIDPDTRIANFAAGGAPTVLILRNGTGAGPGVAEAVAGLAAAKLIIDGGKLAVDAHRARTERMAADLEREKFEAAQRGKK